MMYCKENATYHNTNFSWPNKQVFNGIDPGKHSIVMQEPLKLINVVSLKVEDAGLYTCLASSPAGEDGKNHWVRVQGDTSCSCSTWKNYITSSFSFNFLFNLQLVLEKIKVYLHSRVKISFYEK